MLTVLALVVAAVQTPRSDGAIVFNSSLVYDAASFPTVDVNCHGDRLVFQGDGNFVLQTPRGPRTYVWDSQTYAKTSPTRAQGTTLTFENNGLENGKKKKKKKNAKTLPRRPFVAHSIFRRQYYHQACRWQHCMAGNFGLAARNDSRTIFRRDWQRPALHLARQKHHRCWPTATKSNSIAFCIAIAVSHHDHDNDNSNNNNNNNNNNGSHNCRSHNNNHNNDNNNHHTNTNHNTNTSFNHIHNRGNNSSRHNFDVNYDAACNLDLDLIDRIVCSAYNYHRSLRHHLRLHRLPHFKHELTLVSFIRNIIRYFIV
jgi:hypothetical protein